MHVSISKLTLCIGLLGGICFSAHAQVPARTMLYMYAQAGDYLAIQSMLSQCVSLELKDEYGFTPVCEAIARRDQRTLNTLISFGANPNPPCLKKLPKWLVCSMRPQPMVGHLPNDPVPAIVVQPSADIRMMSDEEYVPEVYATTGGGSKVGRFFRWLF